MLEKILVSIVAYKESELFHTVTSLYNDAEHKDRLLFSVVCQDVTFPKLSSVIPAKQLRYIRVFPQEAWGVCWARSIAQSHFSDYDYYLQLDAHMFSEENWDVKIIQSFKEATKRYDNPILAAYPASYQLSSTGDRSVLSEHHGAPMIHTASFNKKWPEIEWRPAYTQLYYLPGACMFTSRDFVEKVPIDPEITFMSEEIVLSIRAWIAGFTGVLFHSPTFYHMFYRERKAVNASTSPWDDDTKKADYLNDDTRAEKFFKGTLQGKYGAKLQDIEAFMRETGYRDKRTRP